MAMYAMSDLHGCKAFYDLVKSYVNPNDVIYFLGDAGDRGPQSWETIKAIYEDPQITYLKGNHEDMLVKAMEEYLTKDYKTGRHHFLLKANGGEETFNSWVEEGADYEWYQRLKNLPAFETVRNSANEKTIFLSHAGLTPIHNKPIPKDYYLIWDREHFYEPWDEKVDAYVVHGHTPTPYMDGIDVSIEATKYAGALEYCGGRKLCIDNGAFFTGYFTLFNLDTFESIVFQAANND